uniref:Uncharacterized protein n=1 Tax=Daphnia galeata TaxID=27404 RepID=A0A8J2WCY6_9CRUS|nr:unnamed protein product [Daphnia galeata]
MCKKIERRQKLVGRNKTADRPQQQPTTKQQQRKATLDAHFPFLTSRSLSSLACVPATTGVCIEWQLIMSGTLGQTEWPCLCIFAASRVQDGGCHQLWSSSRNNQQQQQLQQRGSSASGVSGGGCREFASLWSPQCVDYPANSSHPKQIIGKQNLREKKSVGMQFVIDYCRHL